MDSLEVVRPGEKSLRTDGNDLACSLVVYNDETNTFDYVIEVLVKVCDHSYVQAEQCTLIIHFRGSCTVKRGSYATLQRMSNAIKRRGLSATVE